MSVLYTNNATTTLGFSINTSVTTLLVASGTGGLFPSISGSDFFFVTLENNSGIREIVKVTARSSDTFTIVRGQDGTSAANWNAGDKVELRITKATLDQLKVDAVSGYALDSAVVHDTGNESVAGVKTFTDGIISSSVQLSGGTGTQGTMSWNADEETADLIQDGATLQLGQELQVHCRNNTASNIANATVVMATGTIGASGRITIAPWDGTTDIKYVLGVSTEVIEAGTDGKVTTFGKVRDVDTGAISGTLTTGVIYAKTDGTGGLTYTKPATNALPLAFLVSAETAGPANNGTIMVRVTPVSEITLDHAETAFTHVSNTSNPHSTTAAQVGAYTTSATDTLLAAKQATLVSGTNIKSVNASSLLASGDLQLTPRTSTTGSSSLPVGTTAQRDGSPSTGYLRFNTTIGKPELYNGTTWGSVGGGATGGGSDAIFIENGQTVTTDYTITSGNNAGTFGPVSIASGVTVTVPSGSVWTIV